MFGFPIRLFFILLIFGFVHNSHAQYSEAELEEFDKIIDSFSPLPVRPDTEIPNYRGIRFVFYHSLEELYNFTRYFNPNHESFLYKKALGFGSDPLERLSNIKMIYEALLEEYLEMKKDPLFDEYTTNQSFFDDPLSPTKSLPKKTKIILQFSDFIVSQFLAEVEISFYINKITSQSVDRRRSTTFFFTEFRSKDYKPLEGMYALTTKGSRSRELLETHLLNTSERLRLIQSEISNLANLVVQSDWQDVTDEYEFYRRWSEINLSLKDIGYQYTLANVMTDSAIRYGNDVNYDREKKFTDIGELEVEMRRLARSLVHLHNEVDAIAAERDNPGFKSIRLQKDNKIPLSDPFVDIPDLFRDHESMRIYRVGGIGVPDELISRYGGKKGLYKVYKESLNRQYIFAAGFLITKIFDTNDIRGGFLSRSLQDFRYQKAKVKIKVTNATLEDRTDKASQVPAERDNLNFNVAATMSKKDYLDSRGLERALLVEDRLWKIFFKETASIFEPKKEDSSLIQIKGKSSLVNSCGRIFL